MHACTAYYAAKWIVQCAAATIRAASIRKICVHLCSRCLSRLCDTNSLVYRPQGEVSHWMQKSKHRNNSIRYVAFNQLKLARARVNASHIHFCFRLLRFIVFHNRVHILRCEQRCFFFGRKITKETMKRRLPRAKNGILLLIGNKTIPNSLDTSVTHMQFTKCNKWSSFDFLRKLFLFVHGR